jgi:hypothetical protein
MPLSWLRSPRTMPEFYITPPVKSREVVYYRPIFLISFLQEVFLRSVMLFQSDFCFMRKDLRFRLRSLSSGGAERSIKRIVAL